MEKSTIYRIDCTTNGRIYVGMSRNYNSRRYFHLHQLWAGTHPTAKLQLDFNAHGEAGFSFSPVREVPRREARAEELNEMRRLAAQGFWLYNPEVNPERTNARGFRFQHRSLPLSPIEFDGPDEELTIPAAASLLKVGRAMVYQFINRPNDPLGHVAIDDKGTKRVLKSQIAAFLNASPRFGGTSHGR